MNPQINKNTRDIAEIFRRLEIDIEQPEIPAGATVTGSGAANRAAYWTAATILGSDAGLQVDTTNDLYIVADGGGIGASNTDVRTLYDTTNHYIKERLQDAAGASRWQVEDSAGTAGVTIDSDGNYVGVGTIKITTDGDKFELYEDDVAEADAFFKLTNTTSALNTFLPSLQMQASGTNASGYQNTIIASADVDRASHTIMSISCRIGGAAVSTADLFRIQNRLVTHFLVDADGHVGINQSPPAYTLDVDGDGRFTGALHLDEVSAPTVAADQVAVYAADNGGTTELIAEFNSGDTVVLARDGGLATYTHCKNGL